MSENYAVAVVTGAAFKKALQIFGECFGVGVMSEAKDGVAPELNPGWVHRRINTYPEVRHAAYVFKTKALSMLCACCTALVLFFPQRDILSRFGRCAIPGYACHSTSAVLVEYRY
ncbi:MAG: hypothetical protein RBR45_08715 [Pseudomonas sp.]|nr:hypothetical protein [Pseudomonas sp.]